MKRGKGTSPKLMHELKEKLKQFIMSVLYNKIVSP